MLLRLIVVGLLATNCAVAQWRPIEQPDLAKTLEAAPELKFEELADGPSVCQDGPVWWVPNPDGKTWDLLMLYSREYPGPHELFIIDTGTKEVKRLDITQPGVNFHILPYFVLNGKMLIKPGIGSSDVNLFTYDPASNDWQNAGLPLGKEVVRGDGPMTANETGTLLGGFGPLTTNRNRVGFYTIDPVTHKGDFLGAVGPDNPKLFWEYCGVVMDGDWIYGRVGNTPWRLYGMNIKTREGKVIAETERIIGERRSITFQTNPAYPGVYVTITGLKGGPVDKTHAFWLRDGKLTSCEPVARNSVPVPPWADEKLAQPRRSFAGRMEGQPPPGIEWYRGAVDNDGQARIWYRYTDATMAQAAQVATGEWQRIELSNLRSYPAPIRRMAPLPDGSLFAVTEGYGRAATFNPKTSERKLYGTTMSVYSMGTVNDQVYLCGYPGSQVWIYDPAKPWDVGRSFDTPPAAEARSTDNRSKAATAHSNPSHVTTLKEFCDVHMPFGIAAGADGRVYFGGKVVRIGNGGGLGWWDPQEKKAGGFHEPFDMYTVFWMCSAAEGRYIVCSTKPVAAANNPDFIPPRGRLFVYDTTKHEIIHQVDDERLGIPGYITEASPGLVMGYTPAKTGGLLYGFDPAAGKVLWTKPVPRAPVTAFSAIRRWRYAFTKGPDGFVWATMDGVLARINPKTAEVVPVGKMDDAQLAFVDGDVYVAGATKFRKIAGIPKVSASKIQP
ncbi:MAG: hypothetical protein PCFJNLEI_00559 [Verrucomicrobiae bacterium]|nr:hypothetical protein [Verrucomicrobiae bacterium]